MASAFSLGAVLGPLEAGPPSDCPTWRLVTSEGAFLAPTSPPDAPWADRGVWPTEVWARWAASGTPWAAALSERLPVVTALSARLGEVYAWVPDWVLTHGGLVDRLDTLAATRTSSIARDG